jgi:hypothetical protein
MRMNISVPDSLAEEARRRKVPISAVCQRAIREEVGRLYDIEVRAHTASEHIIQAIRAAAEDGGVRLGPEVETKIAEAILGCGIS